ncbi:type IVB secretion system protein IcmH/DotU [Sulfurimonas sp.]
MSTDANKTMLVPISQNNDSLTNFNQPQASYNDFRNAVVSHVREHTHDNIYEGNENPILALSSNIFREIYILQNSYDVGTLSEVRNMLIQEVEYFTDIAAKKEIENSQVMLARYVLCTFSDEMIGTTYWGKDNNWANSSLLGHFYNETYGGDKFFEILSQLLKAPAKYVDLLELMYVCLSLGFEGKYKIQNRGKIELDSIRESLYKQMKMMKIRESKHFYGQQNASPKRNHIFYKTSYKILGGSILLLLSLVYGLLTFSLVSKENKALEMFQGKYNKYIHEKSLVSIHLNTVKPAMAPPTNKPPKVIIIKDLND